MQEAATKSLQEVSVENPTTESTGQEPSGSEALVDAGLGEAQSAPASADPLTQTAEPQVEAVGPPDTVAEVQTSSTPEALSWIDFFKPDGIPYAVLILLVMTALARLVSRESNRLGERFADRRLVIQQTGSFIRFLVFLLGILAVVFTLFELTEQMLLAIGGTAAVAAGFAMKDLVASIVAGVIILVDRPFQVGDRVSFAGYYGEITNIGLRSVRLMTLDDTQVTIPNNLFLTQAVASANAGAVDMMIQVDLFIGLDQDVEEARRLLSEVLTTSRYINLNRKWNVGIAEVIQDNYLALRLRAKGYVLDARLEKAFEADITERALRAFRVAGIGPPAVLHRHVD